MLSAQTTILAAVYHQSVYMSMCLISTRGRLLSLCAILDPEVRRIVLLAKRRAHLSPKRTSADGEAPHATKRETK